MTASAVSICSNALLMLGAKEIASFNESTDRAKLAANLYPLMRRAFLRSHPWNAAIKRVALATEAGAPAFDYLRQFLLPSDFVRVLNVGRNGYNTNDYKLEGRRILSNDTVLYLRYLSNIDESEWDQSMVDTMTLLAAARFAYPVTGSASLRESLLADAQDSFRRAKSVDGQEDVPDAWDDSPLIDSRGLGGGW